MDLQTDKLNFKQTGIPGGLTLVGGVPQMFVVSKSEEISLEQQSMPSCMQ